MEKMASRWPEHGLEKNECSPERRRHSAKGTLVQAENEPVRKRPASATLGASPMPQQDAIEIVSPSSAATRFAAGGLGQARLLFLQLSQRSSRLPSECRTLRRRP